MRQLRGGEFGAVLVEDERGRRAVLETMPDRPPWSGGWAAGVGLVEEVRATGYPAPRYLAAGALAGCLCTLQEEMPGAVPRRMTAALAAQLLALAERHAGRAGRSRPAGAPEWQAYVRDTLQGRRLPERTAVLRTASPDAGRLVDEVHAAGRRLAGLPLPDGDVVHGDFHHRNALAVGDRVTAVIDWEQAANGDWRFDVAWLAFWCRVDTAHVDREAAELTADRVSALLDPDERAAYAGLLALRVLGLFADLWPDRLPAATGWCESLLAPAWRGP